MDLAKFLGDSVGEATDNIIAKKAGDFVENAVCEFMSNDKDNKEEDKGGDKKDEDGKGLGALLSLGKDKEESGGGFNIGDLAGKLLK